MLAATCGLACTALSAPPPGFTLVGLQIEYDEEDEVASYDADTPRGPLHRGLVSV
jgi:hypothetical protein